MKIVSEVVRVFDVEPFVIGGHSDDDCYYRFRLEVARNLNTNTYIGRVYRLESYRLQPTFPQVEGHPPDWQDDALIYVLDHMFGSDMLSGESVDEIVEKFQKSLNDIFEIGK
jgi:hypothetical protein